MIKAAKKTKAKRVTKDSMRQHAARDHSPTWDDYAS